MTQVLIVEDDPKIRANLLFQLRDDGLAPRAEESAEAVLPRLLEGDLPDLLLLDVRLPGMSGVELVRRLAEAGRLPPTIIVSGEASITETVEALGLGVHDFIEKPFSRERLLQSIRNTLDHTALRRRVAELTTELDGERRILGTSPAIVALREQIARGAPTDARVIIRGESGTGKELVADALHHGSPRRDRPFIKINCAAIPAHLIEDELFGHRRGAFTDARSDKPGLFEEADGGTLFLDEIGDMELGLQSRLLRFLEDGKVRRLGDVRERQVDVRVLAATHADLEGAVEAGTFRQDLYFRLCTLPIEVPPLRQRGDDVQLLFDHFLAAACRRHRTRLRQVADTVYPALKACPWPGNVRQLKAVCERLVVFGGDPVTIDQLPSSVVAPATLDDGSELVRFDPAAAVLPLRDWQRRSEREYLEKVLAKTGWNVSAAARLLGIQRTHLHHKLKQLGCHRPGTRAGGMPEGD